MIHCIAFASMIKIASASVHVDFKEQNDSLILIITCLLTFIDTGLFHINLGS